MTGRTFTMDLGRMMDEAFRFAEQLGETFGADATEAAERLRQAAEHFGRTGPGGAADAYPAYLYPPANIYLTRDKRMVLEIALAGFEEKDISVQFRGDYLVFSAKAPPAVEPEEGIQYFKRRLRMRDVDEQRYYVPADKFDQAASAATFHGGLLRVVVPPREQPPQDGGIRISIRTDGST